MTEIQRLGEIDNKNCFYIKRDDLLSFSFGGNKARKASLFFKDIDKEKADYVLTYGTGSSNHCRVVANMAAARNLPCTIISPKDTLIETFNTHLVRLFGANILTCHVNQVSSTIHQKMKQLKEQGYTPYFIQGGGHGEIGTQAYVDCFSEIADYERKQHINFDYVFLASGTGTTQAGLVCGKLLKNSNVKIVGISIARKSIDGRDVVSQSVANYLASREYNLDYDSAVFFTDEYIVDGYGTSCTGILNTIKEIMCKFGIPLNATYTGKAFWGMREYLIRNEIQNKNILFLNTGGSPLFFDDLEKLL